MNLTQIYTKRNLSSQNYAQSIIYEWEDVIAKEIGIPIVNISLLYKLANKLRIHSSYVGPSDLSFRFVSNARDYDSPMNTKNIIPCVIDFFESKKQLIEFYHKHSKNRLVLVSSPFDYAFLKEHNCPLNVELFAYSLPDKYIFSENKQEKKYDIVLTGRQDPLLYSFFKEYIKHHPDVSYVKRGQDIDNDFNKAKAYYMNGKDYLGLIESRDDFIKLQSQGRVTLYGLQGYYEGYTQGYYHMTPHFLEIISCGSHVLCRYPKGKNGVDANYYEFDKFSPSIETYEQFELYMDKALTSDVDFNMYSAYLKKHSTSSRVKRLKEILKNL